MSTEPDPSPAEAVLAKALKTGRPDGTPARAERHDRLQKAVRLETARQDIGKFALKDVFATLGKVLLTLWNLATGAAEISKPDRNPTKTRQDEDDR